MYTGSIPHDRILAAFTRHVPGAYVRDYRDNGGFITVCRDYKDIPWRDQTTTRRVETRVPAVTLVSLPKGNVTAPSLFNGLSLVRTGWRIEFRRAMRHLSENQMRRITKELKVGEVFPGII